MRTIKNVITVEFKNSGRDMFTFAEPAKDHIITTVSHPMWKLRWIPRYILEDTRNNIKKIVLKALKEIASPDHLLSRNQSSLSSQNTVQDVENDYFVSFMEELSDESFLHANSCIK